MFTPALSKSHHRGISPPRRPDPVRVTVLKTLRQLLECVVLADQQPGPGQIQVNIACKGKHLGFYSFDNDERFKIKVYTR